MKPLFGSSIQATAALIPASGMPAANHTSFNHIHSPASTERQQFPPFLLDSAYNPNQHSFYYSHRYYFSHTKLATLLIFPVASLHFPRTPLLFRHPTGASAQPCPAAPPGSDGRRCPGGRGAKGGAAAARGRVAGTGRRLSRTGRRRFLWPRQRCPALLSILATILRRTAFRWRGWSPPRLGCVPRVSTKGGCGLHVLHPGSLSAGSPRLLPLPSPRTEPA